MMNRPKINVGPNDVLCGRGRESFHHIGNKRFRETVTSMIDRFRQAKTRRDRSAVVAAIWDNVKSRGGRFLKKNEWRSLQSQQDFMGTGPGGDWYQLSDAQAKEKVAHAIRDACANSMDTQSRRGSLISVGRRSSDASGTGASLEAKIESSTTTTTNKLANDPITTETLSRTTDTSSMTAAARLPSIDNPSSESVRKPTKAQQQKNDIYQNLQSLAQELKRDKARQQQSGQQQSGTTASLALRGPVDADDSSNFDYEPEPLYDSTDKKKAEGSWKLEDNMEPLAAAPFGKPNALATTLKADFETEQHQPPFAIAGTSNDFVGAPPSRSASTSPPTLEQQINQQSLHPAPDNLFMGKPQANQPPGSSGGREPINTERQGRKRKSPPFLSIQPEEMMGMDFPLSPDNHPPPVPLLANPPAMEQDAGVGSSKFSNTSVDSFMEAIDDALGPMSAEDTALQQQHDDPLMALLLAQRHHRGSRKSRAQTQMRSSSLMGQHSEESRASSSSNRKRARTDESNMMGDDSEEALGTNITMV